MLKQSRSKNIYAAAAILAVLFTAGCSEEPDKSKEAMEAAFAKQAEINTYSFAGSAALNIRLPAAKENGNPLTGLFGLFTQGKLEWEGAASYEPVRLEADLKSVPDDSGTPLELPIILKDNKLYLHIPVLSTQEDYFSVDMSRLSQLSGNPNPFTEEDLKNTTLIITEALRLALTGIDAKWFKEESALTLEDGAKAAVYRLDITEKNRAELEAAIKTTLPDWAGLLANSGLLSQEQADALQKQGGSLTVQAPGHISAAVDEAGFIRRHSLDIAYEYMDADGQASSGSIAFEHSVNDINGTPVFRKQPPANPRSLDDILQLLLPSFTRK